MYQQILTTLMSQEMEDSEGELNVILKMVKDRKSVKIYYLYALKGFSSPVLVLKEENIHLKIWLRPSMDTCHSLKPSTSQLWVQSI